MRKGNSKHNVSKTRTANLADITPADHDLNVLGVSNVTRYFDLDDPSNGPTVIFRTVVPMAGITEGFSATENDGWSVGDYTAATDTTAVPTDPLYAITHPAMFMEADVWPILQNLFASGTGTRPTVSFSEFVRYQTMLMKAYSFMLLPITLNNLAYHFDWDTVFPFESTVPHYLYDLASDFDATDIGLANRWLPLMKNIEHMIMFPRALEEIKRQLTPMLSVDLNGRLFVPVTTAIQSVDVDALYNAIVDYVNYINVELVDVSTVLTSFLPFVIKDQDPWNMPSKPVIDIDRESAWFNSPTKNIKTFEDTTDPTIKECVLFDEATGSTAIYYTRHTQPIWAEIKNCSLYEITDDATDDKYRLVNLHRLYSCAIHDDQGDVFVYNGVTVDTTSLGFRYIDYVNSRFASTDVDFGTMKPGLIGCTLELESVVRLTRLDVSYQYSIETLKDVTSAAAGSSLRELRMSIKTTVSEGLKSRI